MKITREKLAELIEAAMCGMGAPVAIDKDCNAICADSKRA